MPGVAHEVQQRALDHEIGQIHLDGFIDRGARDERRRRGLRVRAVETVLVLDEDHVTAAVGLGDEVAARVGAVGRDDASSGTRCQMS